MSDQLKKYLQQNKAKLDLDNPNPDLFDKIIVKLEDQSKITLASKAKSINWKMILSVAASICILIMSYVYYYNTPLNKDQFINEVAINQQNQVSAEAISHTQENSHKSIDQISEQNSITKLPQKDTRSNPFRSSIMTNKKTRSVANSSNAEMVNTIKTDLSNEKLSVNSVIHNMNEVKEIVTVQTKVVESKTESTPSKVSSEMDLNNLQNEVSPSLSTPKDNSKDIAIQNSSKTLKRGLVDFLFKKIRKHTNQSINIEKNTEDNNSVIAVNIFTKEFGFSKNIKIGNSLSN